ncbi:hypothetical protein N7471_004373 [Penicillium samsonianum]|uniref:uncharacterized protein n=1 Tax=Penicillium samsonianum TaxID=1882272 RepID=UPI00254859C6|nr:uncharacterized protein N7471_004373 [Penicillium samsonianum]KAJ6137887.1 hypothetical protein N7471_004373 [Penicillium samsonianum]
MHSANEECEYPDDTALYFNTPSTRTSKDWSEPPTTPSLRFTSSCLAQISAGLYDIVEEIPPHSGAFVDVLPLQT